MTVRGPIRALTSNCEIVGAGELVRSAIQRQQGQDMMKDVI